MNESSPPQTSDGLSASSSKSRLRRIFGWSFVAFNLVQGFLLALSDWLRQSGPSTLDTIGYYLHDIQDIGIFFPIFLDDWVGLLIDAIGEKTWFDEQSFILSRIVLTPLAYFTGVVFADAGRRYGWWKTTFAYVAFSLVLGFVSAYFVIRSIFGSTIFDEFFNNLVNWVL